MLGEFHQQAKSDGKACHATYILSGFIEEVVPTNDAMQIDGDDYLMSSQPVPTQESSTSNVARTKMIRTIALADEDGVHGATKSISANPRLKEQICRVDVDTCVQSGSSGCQSTTLVMSLT
jgi:hypothetical protein